MGEPMSKPLIFARRLAIAAGASLAIGASSAQALSIASGGSLTGVVVDGTDSVYQIFGHSGSPGGGGASTDAVQIDFGADTGNVFTFSASGLVNCCNGAPNIPPDGGGSGMNVGGANGLSGLSGNRNVPLVGVFTTGLDPFGGFAPAALSFDGANPTSLTPLLHQVFYIGDGRAGYDNAGGAQLTFTAPTNATRLYLGAIDAVGFNAQTGYYADNPGSWTVSVDLAAQPGAVPEPGTWTLMIGGFAAAGGMLRRRRTTTAH